MDSGNSSSMQSSSGGDEEYDSRADSISAFLNNPPPSHVGAFSTNPHPQHTQHTHMFNDPLSNYLDPPMQRSPSSLSNPNSFLNLDMVWSKPARSEPNPVHLGALIPSSSSPQNQAFFSSQSGGQTRGAAFSTIHHPLPPQSGSPGLLSVSAANDQAQAHNNTANSNVVRNPKKRPRASRRAPTTVLTTDTTNFRAMVQEFTGIPAPPFTSSPFPRSRLDLFAPSPIRSTHLDSPPPPYLLRPFAHKVQPHPLPFVSHLTTSSCSSIPPSFPTSSILDTLPNSTTTNSTSINYQLSSDLSLLKQQPPPPPQNNLINVNMHNPILNFQSILQATSKYPLGGNSSLLASNTQGSLEIAPTTDSHIKMGVLEEFGLNQAHVNANISELQNMVPSSSDGALSRGNMNNPLSDWGAERTGTNNDGDHGVLRSLSGSYRNTERVTNGKVNHSGSSSDFHGEKGPPECVAAARSEGMVESWINCSSD